MVYCHVRCDNSSFVALISCCVSWADVSLAETLAVGMKDAVVPLKCEAKLTEIIASAASSFEAVAVRGVVWLR